ncbi:MAG: hypothetical protein KDA20_02675 [Phycisphaerales bacterium]|nr:hypothetical protein [Phycisphaerales bacterium]
MPFTPFHFGPAAAAHAIAPKHISFLAFCSVNVLIDIEPLYFMLTDQYPLHRFLHTYLGASAAILLTLALFLAAQRLAQRIPLPNLFHWKQLTLPSVALGAALGAFSHIALDSIMHADIHPLAPFSDTNALFRVISLRALHIGCVSAGLVGAIALALRAAFRPSPGTGNANAL